MRRHLALAPLAALALTLALMAAACGGGRGTASTPIPTSSPTPEPRTVRVSTPIPVATETPCPDVGPSFAILPPEHAASVDISGSLYAVLDTSSGLVQKVAMASN